VEENGRRKFIPRTVVDFSGVFPLQAILRGKKDDHRLWFVDASGKLARNVQLNKFLMELGFGPIFSVDQYQKMKGRSELLADMDQVKHKLETLKAEAAKGILSLSPTAPSVAVPSVMTGNHIVRVVLKRTASLPTAAVSNEKRSEARQQDKTGVQVLSLRARVLSPRSESRPPQVVSLPQTWTLDREPWTVGKLLAKNKELGGSGTLEGFEGVTDKIMEGIVSLVAYNLNAAELAISLLPAPLAQKAVKIMAQARLAKAREMLGIKTIQPGDVFILGRELALPRGFLEAIRDILGPKPVAVAVRSDSDIARLKQFNSQLMEDQRIMITSDDESILRLHPDSVMSVKAAEIELKRRVKTGHPNLRVLLYGGETLKGAIPDAIQRITQQMFQNFIRMAGADVAARISRLAEEFRATSRSA